jgi:hypothetical protein
MPEINALREAASTLIAAAPAGAVLPTMRAMLAHCASVRCSAATAVQNGGGISLPPLCRQRPLWPRLGGVLGHRLQRP